MSDEHDTRPDPLEIPSAEWLLHHLSDQGDNAGADYNDHSAIDGYFGWSVTPWKNSLGDVLRHELEVWWEPSEEDAGPEENQPKRHIRRFWIEEITGQRGAVTEVVD